MRTFSRHRFAVIGDISALTLLALVVNFVHIGTKSIDLDESTSVLIAGKSLGSLFDGLTKSDPNMSLYLILLNGWVRIFGESEVAVRSPSAIFAALAVPTIYLLGCRLFGRTTGIVAGLLLALNAFCVHYAQTARAYALVLFLITLSSYLLVLELQRPSMRTRVGYVIASVLAVHAHYFAALVPLAHLITVAALRPGPALRRKWLGVAVAIGLLCLPEMLIAYHVGPDRIIGWIRPASVYDLSRVFVDFAGRSRVVLGVLLASGGLASMYRKPLERRWPVGFLALWLLVPVAISFLVSLVQPMFLSYYLIVCVPALTLLGAAGIARISPPMATVVVALGIIVLSAIQLTAFYSRPAVQDWRAATRYVTSAAGPGDGVVFFTDSARKPFEYHLRRDAVAGPTTLNDRLLPSRDRVWFVIRESDVAIERDTFERLRTKLSGQYRLAERRRFGWVAIERYVRPSPSPVTAAGFELQDAR